MGVSIPSFLTLFPVFIVGLTVLAIAVLGFIFMSTTTVVPISSVPVPGRRCPACLERGDTVWVIPGKCCPQCGTPVN
jgi:rRNA maturation endonuclease Nob1